MATKEKALSFASSQETYWATQAIDADAFIHPSTSGNLGCSRVSLGWSRATPTGTREDRAVTTISVAKIVGGGLYTKVAAAELAGLEVALDAMYATLRPNIGTEYTLVEYAWHEVTENSPRDDSGKSQLVGPAVRTTVKSLGGTNGGMTMPYQVAETVTFRTVSRKHWGRCYIPGGTHTVLTSNGRWLTSYVNTIADAFNVLHNSWQDAGYQLGIWSFRYKAFLTPKTIEADDVPDIQRRRRAKQAAYRRLDS